MYKQPGQEEFLFYTLYTGAAMLSLIACCYLLFRRANAIAPDITPPARLRRWTAVFFGAMTLSHVWYMPDYFGPASFHENDYSFFYKNLQENVAKRIAAYKEK